MKLHFGNNDNFLEENGFVPMQTTDERGVMVFVPNHYINKLGIIVKSCADSPNGYKEVGYMPDKNGYDRRGYNVIGNNMMKRRNIVVAQNFIPNPNKLPFINHKNRDIIDNRIENLEWVTCMQNAQHEKKTRHLRKIIPNKPILQLEDIGNGYYKLVNRFNSKKDIPKYLDNNPHKVDKANIIAVCNTDEAFKYRKTYRGYKWIYEEDKNNFNIV